MQRSLTWVLKISKLCNLRCRYCYEFDSLGDPKRIPLTSLSVMFERAREISEHFGSRAKFCWHGGEPLLLPEDYFAAAFEIQQRCFAGTDYRPLNVIQTNLTALTPARVAVLQRFDQVSISLDVVGGLRVKNNGADAQESILRNMAVLRNKGIRFGAISVLTRRNVDDVATVFRFFNHAGIHCRLLPYYRSASPGQLDEYGLSADQLIAAYKQVLDLWLTEGRGISVVPIEDYARAAIAFLMKKVPGPVYNKAEREYIYVVDTDGALYSTADTYQSGYSHGNLLTDSALGLLHSQGRRRAIAESQSRQAKHCRSCRFLGACSTFPIAEATEIERSLSKTRCAIASALIDYAVTRIDRLGILPSTLDSEEIYEDPAVAYR